MHTHQEKIFATFPENQKANVKKKKNAEIPSEACWLLYAVLSLIKSVMRRFSQPLTWQQLRGDSRRLWGAGITEGPLVGKAELSRVTPALGFPGGSLVKNLPANAGVAGSIPASRRSLGEGNGNPLQYFCLGNPMDRGAWWAAVYGIVRVSDTT